MQHVVLKKNYLFHFDILAAMITPMESNNPKHDHGLALDEDVIEPKEYKVLIHNDDYTPMDFVIFILKKFFSKTDAQATEVMLDVHNKGIGIAGIYSYEVAETKVVQANQFAKNNQYPLKTSYEEV